MRQVLAQRVDDGDGLVRRADADVHVDAEDLQPPGQPLHPLDELEVALLRRDELGLPVGERVGARAHEAQPAAVGGGHDLGEGAGQVGLGLLDRRADAGDDLDRRLEQLVLGLRVLLGAVGADLLEDLHGTGRQLPGLAVDELQLPLHAEAGAGRGLERDLHVGSLGSITVPPPPWITRPGSARHNRAATAQGQDRNRRGVRWRRRRDQPGTATQETPAMSRSSTRRAAVLAILTPSSPPGWSPAPVRPSPSPSKATRPPGPACGWSDCPMQPRREHPVSSRTGTRSCSARTADSRSPQPPPPAARPGAAAGGLNPRSLQVAP